jgi:hypothetical protein
MRAVFEADGNDPGLGSEVENKPAQFSRDDPVLPSNELVLLFGPPLSGKTRYFEEKLLSRGFTRVSAVEMFKTDPLLSLRGVAKQVCALLAEGKNVCLDDENAKAETRKAYIDLVKQRLPQTRTRAVCFWPFGGLKQCLWAREYALAERHSTAGFASVAEIGEWFSSLSRKPPKRFEGFEHVLNVRSYLYCNSLREMNRSCLFVDAASVCHFVSIPGTQTFECQLRSEEIGPVLREWYQKEIFIRNIVRSVVVI